jgi:hypothetical protein
MCYENSMHTLLLQRLGFQKNREGNDYTSSAFSKLLANVLFDQQHTNNMSQICTWKGQQANRTRVLELSLFRNIPSGLVAAKRKR